MFVLFQFYLRFSYFQALRLIQATLLRLILFLHLNLLDPLGGHANSSLIKILEGWGPVYFQYEDGFNKTIDTHQT